MALTLTVFCRPLNSPMVNSSAPSETKTGFSATFFSRGITRTSFSLSDLICSISVESRLSKSSRASSLIEETARIMRVSTWSSNPSSCFSSSSTLAWAISILSSIFSTMSRTNLVSLESSIPSLRFSSISLRFNFSSSSFSCSKSLFFSSICTKKVLFESTIC